MRIPVLVFALQYEQCTLAGRTDERSHKMGEQRDQRYFRWPLIKRLDNRPSCVSPRIAPSTYSKHSGSRYGITLVCEMIYSYAISNQ